MRARPPRIRPLGKICLRLHQNATVQEATDRLRSCLFREDREAFDLLCALNPTSWSHVTGAAAKVWNLHLVPGPPRL